MRKGFGTNSHEGKSLEKNIIRGADNIWSEVPTKPKDVVPKELLRKSPEIRVRQISQLNCFCSFYSVKLHLEEMHNPDLGMIFVRVL